ncbi:MAG: Sensory transduction regulatory protein [Candidatus Kaiserbacteria bacterium GW2011_GWC2_52_8b]|uniref:histidine kinase n=2 Tax=Candidatus Kaiseribacteriota TaxID=1752734 RepID=A0A0G1XLI9_9BACT|nr:MAG: Sensory transduction regulatory protein [Candidatus Kaiserbacteria bacterium GW2011_GWA2_52_12]KKW31735.1 MAG: Sensory transduction regulatory protein [Candidatus Kaiserbacteria bacterium GW2011_GWC2_52_8b]
MHPHERVFDPLGDPKDGHILTQAIIDTIHEPLIVLDEDLRIIVASRAFYKKFNLTHENTRETMFYDLGNGQWNIPALRTLLEDVIPKHTAVEDYEIEHDFPFLGRRIMSVNAREIRSDNDRKKMLLSIFDVTDQRSLEADRETLLLQKDLLLKEMRHRVANSLQLIASILLLKAEMTTSKESRAHLEDAHERIMTIATVQQQLDPVAHGEDIAVGAYLNALCKSLTRTMIGGRKPITIEVKASQGSVLSDVAVSFGLLTTELVINALKHAFIDGRTGTVTVSYEARGSDWTLSVGDNGVGMSESEEVKRVGLGTSIVGALANQLQAIIRKESSSKGTTVSIIHSQM